MAILRSWWQTTNCLGERGNGEVDKDLLNGQKSNTASLSLFLFGRKALWGRVLLLLLHHVEQQKMNDMERPK